MDEFTNVYWDVFDAFNPNKSKLFKTSSNWFEYGPIYRHELDYSLSEGTDTDGNPLIQIPFPGYSKEDIKVSIEGNLLTISADIKEEEQTYFRKSFDKVYRLYEQIDADQVSAEMKNGLLTITIHKKERSTNIDIK